MLYILLLFISAHLFLSPTPCFAQKTPLTFVKEANAPKETPFEKWIINIFTNYYKTLEQEMRKSWGASPEAIETSKKKIEDKLNLFWSLPKFAGLGEERYLEEIQNVLQNNGFYINFTRASFIKTGNLHLESVAIVTVRPILSRTKRIAKIGFRELPYTEVLLGESLVDVPKFIMPPAEIASPSEVVIFPYDLYRLFYEEYETRKDSIERTDNGRIECDANWGPTRYLPCLSFNLYGKQWGTDEPGEKELDLIINQFRLHAQQHILDYELRPWGRSNFALEDKGLSQELNEAAVIEARAALHQLLLKSLVYENLTQIVRCEIKWNEGNREEHVVAGHILFQGLSTNGIDWNSRVENLTIEDIYNASVLFAYHNHNYLDMLTSDQFKEVKHLTEPVAKIK